MATIWKPESQLLESLDAAVPDILASQKENGQFGTEPWISTDQNVMLALAAAWSREQSSHYHSEAVLDAVVRGGDALIEAQDDEGKFTFRKKDHSTWGQILMPWIYSRWMRAYSLVGEAMPEDARRRWDDALLLGFDGISRTALGHMHNIPTHHAMGLYCAGTVFDREDWKAQSTAFMQQVVEAQSPHGWWPEHKGPVVSYNFVYSDGLGVYYAMSGDEGVLEALERAARYHANFTYPDGSAAETVDGRNPYHGGVRLGNPGFSYSPIGRGYLAQQHALHLQAGESFTADYAAHLLLYGGEGEIEETAAARERHLYRMGDEAMTRRHRPWFFCLSAFVVEIPRNRWGQDRQNFVSVFHDRTGLIVGGGNTKLQPLWSTFTVGDASLLAHTPGDQHPDFSPREGLIHTPGSASYRAGEDASDLTLNYGEETCTVTLVPRDETRMTLAFEATTNSGMAVEGHVTLIPHPAQALRFASGDSVVLEEDAIERAAESDGDWIEHAGWRLSLPQGARVVWPAVPHNPYRKAGEATVEEALLVVVLPFSPAVARYELSLQVL